MIRLALLAGLLATGATAQLVAPVLPSDATPPAPLGPGVIGTPAGTGAWPAVAESVADAPGYTLYHPARMPAKMPLLLWGNGGCKDNGLAASRFLREVASHGYFIVANGAPRFERPPVDVLPAVNGRSPGNSPPVTTPDETKVEQLLAAIGWAEGANKAGPFKGRIDTSRIAVMGTSCGGLQSLKAGADPRIDTVIAFNSGVYNRPNNAPGRLAMVKDDLKKLHTPVAYILGGPDDIAYENGSDDVERIAHVPVFYGNLPVGHSGTYQLPNGGAYGRVAVAWFDWQLKKDRKAGAMFAGKDCGLCTDKNWTIVRKQFPEKP